MISPAAQRLMAERAGATIVEVRGSHAVYLSRPEAVAQLIAAGGSRACGQLRSTFRQHRAGAASSTVAHSG